MVVRHSFLEEIVQSKKRVIEHNLSQDPNLSKIKALLKGTPPIRDFYQALSKNNHLSLIAEIKRASPSKGIIRPDLNPISQAKSYQDFGASATSVLTDEDYFHGSLTDLIKARSACRIPILRKDFIIHPYQIYEARVSGADALLLIAAILSKEDLLEFVGLSQDLGMYPLVEVHSEEEIPIAIGSGAKIIGINNRDLTTFRVDLETTARLARFIPKDRLLVSESGIKGVKEAKQVCSWGVKAILVGEALVTNPDLGTLIRDLTQIPIGCQ